MSYRLRNRSAVDRFWFAVVKRESGCWLYRNCPDKYGVLRDDSGKTKTAHRFSYELHHGPIPKGMYVCHKCDVRGCVNPDHLYAGTHEDNTRDIVERGRANSPANIAARERMRATDAVMREQIKAEYATGMFSMNQLAKKYNCSQSTISCTIRNVHNCSSGKQPTRRTGNFRSKMPPEARQEIKQKYATGKYTQTQLAAEYGVTQTRISSIVTDADLKRSKTIPYDPETPQ